ncbi:helix-turn-helix domain-containing protein [Cognatishimia sp. MH4019]|uniref:helix-turn-helix domain-containing protein n=1 Tax=Cognatishimia sp. MH4019 TaxID=2854030 RepID=UPI001CD605F0|nr:helix-turn-helix domain-containing protein [Cognatishimia sp. MH4019]
MSTKAHLKIILRVISDYRGVSEGEIKGAGRQPHLVWPRFEFCALARTLTEASLPQIGMAIGGRDHTTIMNALKRVTKNLENSPVYVQDFATLREIAENAIDCEDQLFIGNPSERDKALRLARHIIGFCDEDRVWKADDLKVMARHLLGSDSQLQGYRSLKNKILEELTDLT